MDLSHLDDPNPPMGTAELCELVARKGAKRRATRHRVFASIGATGMIDPNPS